jgi:phenylalanyl-tRNA synthetase beta chain
MPTVELSRKVVEDLIGKKLSDSVLLDRIPMLGTDLKDLTKEIIHVEIFPNRPDLLSEQGFARALSSFIGHKKGMKTYKVKKSNEKVIVDHKLKNIRPYTAAAIAKNINFTDEKIREIIQIQEKLHTTFCRNRRKSAIGIYPMEKIKFPIYFKAVDPKKLRFIPLESERIMDGHQVLAQHPKGKEYAYLIEKLPKFPVFYDSNNEVLSLTPIINSELTGKVTSKTKDVFIEVSGHDLEAQKICLNILVTALADMGADIYSLDVVYNNKKILTPDLTPKKMEINFSYINKHLGLSLSKSDIKNLFRKMGHEVSGNKVLIPPYRADIMHQVDLAEDIAIAYGFENFTSEIPKVATIGEESEIEMFKRKLSNLLIGLNLIETNTYHISNPSILNKNMNLNHKLIELENPKNIDYSVMRNSMLPILLDVLSNNRHNEYPQNIFEIGTIFNLGASETGTVEHESLSCLFCDNDADFTKIKQILDYISKNLDIKFSLEESSHPSFIEGRSAKIKAKGKTLGFIGEFHPSVLESFSLEVPVAGLEVNVSELMKVLA